MRDWSLLIAWGEGVVWRILDVLQQNLPDPPPHDSLITFEFSIVPHFILCWQ